jgi:uncharacterized protein (UPF0335 family)
MPVSIASNTIEGRALALAGRIEVFLIAIELEQEACREACVPMREDIKEIWAEAKAGSLPIKAMRAYLRVRTAQRKAVARLKPDERDAYDRLRESLGPLGAAAAKRAGYPADEQTFALAVDRAFSEGKLASTANQPATPPYAADTPQYRAYLDGYAENQAALVAKLGQGNGQAEAAPET